MFFFIILCILFRLGRASLQYKSKAASSGSSTGRDYDGKGEANAKLFEVLQMPENGGPQTNG